MLLASSPHLLLDSHVQEKTQFTRGTLILTISVFVLGFARVSASEPYYSKFLSEIRADDISYRVNYWPTPEVHNAALIDTNNTAPKFTRSNLAELTIKPKVAVAGIELGMTMDKVVSLWGKPRAVSRYNNGAPRLSYRDAIHSFDEYASADVLFDPGTNSVIAIWVVFWNYSGKPFLSPKVDECIRVLGEPTSRDYIPDPLDPPQKPPNHWYCRMLYKDTALVLYFANGQLMALEVNPQAKGVAQDEGSDDYSIRFCLAP
jgi:hypothetical protein